jgi:hypothetical protein
MGHFYFLININIIKKIIGLYGVVPPPDTTF